VLVNFAQVTKEPKPRLIASYLMCKMHPCTGTEALYRPYDP